MTSSIDIVGSELSRDAIIPYLVEVSIPEGGFLQVKESLTRVGIPGGPGEDGKPKLYQTCHVLTKRGKYYICHFKTFFVLDGKKNNLTTGDISRQNLIAQLLEEWNLLSIVDRAVIGDNVCSLKTVKIVKFHDRDNWTLVSKYDVGAGIRRLHETIAA
jgi:hypothetical protein